MRWLTLALASGCFLSYVPVRLQPHRHATGAGMVGSLWGVWLLKYLPVSSESQIMVWTGVVLVSVAVSEEAEELLGKKDDQRIVIDELVGFFTAMLFLPRSLPAIILAFILFRLLDTWKPLGIRHLGELPGGWGVVLDDVAAGAAANVFLHLLQFIHPL